MTDKSENMWVYGTSLTCLMCTSDTRVRVHARRAPMSHDKACAACVVLLRRSPRLERLIRGREGGRQCHGLRFAQRSGDVVRSERSAVSELRENQRLLLA